MGWTARIAPSTSRWGRARGCRRRGRDGRRPRPLPDRTPRPWLPDGRDPRDLNSNPSGRAGPRAAAAMHAPAAVGHGRLDRRRGRRGSGRRSAGPWRSRRTDCRASGDRAAGPGRAYGRHCASPRPLRPGAWRGLAAAGTTIVLGAVVIGVAGGEIGGAATRVVRRLLLQPGQADEIEPTAAGQAGDGGGQLDRLAATAILLLGRALGGDEREELRRLLVNCSIRA